jgi:hypothetical protein
MLRDLADMSESVAPGMVFVAMPLGQWTRQGYFVPIKLLKPSGNFTYHQV